MRPKPPRIHGFSLVTAGYAPKEAARQGTNPTEELGMTERQLVMSVTGPQRRLDYPTKKERNSLGKEIEIYLIPQEEKKAVLEKLYFFTPVPDMDTVLFDLHQRKPFTVRDFLVTREGEGNFLVSPYYLETGGTMLDWLDMQPGQSPDDYIVECRPFNPDLTDMLEYVRLECGDNFREAPDEFAPEHRGCDEFNVEEYRIEELDDEEEDF